MMVRALFIVLSAFCLTAAYAKAPLFTVDPSWPQPLPNRWILGQVTGVATDTRNQIWVLNRPASITDDEKVTGAVAAPPLVVFDQAGRLIAYWPVGTRGENWPHREHSIAVDPKDGSVWISGNGDDDGFIVKYSAEGKFLLRIGQSGPSKGSNDISQLGRVSGLTIDGDSKEIFVADGYANRRVIVFDTVSGAYKRHWGAYGHVPVDGPIADRKSQFMQPHGIALAKDGTLYIGDRPNNRIQYFKRDGTYLGEIVQRPETGGGTGGTSGSVGSIWDAAFWPAIRQDNILLVDGSNSEVRVTQRTTQAISSTFGRTGPYAGEFRWAHTIAVDDYGNVYVGEVSTGKRVQRFRPKIKK
jgi:NHL repeat